MNQSIRELRRTVEEYENAVNKVQFTFRVAVSVNADLCD
jgi:hypothetical protein